MLWWDYSLCGPLSGNGPFTTTAYLSGPKLQSESALLSHSLSHLKRFSWKAMAEIFPLFQEADVWALRCYQSPAFKAAGSNNHVLLPGLGMVLLSPPAFNFKLFFLFTALFHL